MFRDFHKSGKISTSTDLVKTPLNRKGIPYKNVPDPGIFPNGKEIPHYDVTNLGIFPKGKGIP